MFWDVFSQFLGVKFGIWKCCLCKRNYKYQVCICVCIFKWLSLTHLYFQALREWHSVRKVRKAIWRLHTSKGSHPSPNRQIFVANSLWPHPPQFFFVWDTSMFAGFGTVLLPNISSILKFCNIIGNVPHPSHHPGFSATLPWRQKSNPMPAILELISDNVATGTARLTNLMLHQANTYTLAS